MFMYDRARLSLARVPPAATRSARRRRQLLVRRRLVADESQSARAWPGPALARSGPACAGRRGGGNKWAGLNEASLPRLPAAWMTQ